jgi:hypothetical protein
MERCALECVSGPLPFSLCEGKHLQARHLARLYVVSYVLCVQPLLYLEEAAKFSEGSHLNLAYLKGYRRWNNTFTLTARRLYHFPRVIACAHACTPCMGTSTGTSMGIGIGTGIGAGIGRHSHWQKHRHRHRQRHRAWTGFSTNSVDPSRSCSLPKSEIVSQTL